MADDQGKKKERRISLLINQSTVFFFFLRIPDYHDLLVRYESPAARLKNLGLLGAFYARLGLCEFTFGHFDQANRILNNALGLCKAAGNAEEACTANFISALTHLYRGDYESVLALKEDALRMMEANSYVRYYVRPLCTASFACSELGRWDEAADLGTKALSAARDFSDNSLVSWAAWTTSLAHAYKRDLDRAIEYAELAVSSAPTPGEKAFAQATLAWAWCHTGEPGKGIRVLVELIALYQATRYVPPQLPAVQFLGEGYWLAGEYDKARETAQGLLELAEGCGARGYLGHAHRLLGEVALKTNPDHAAFHFDKAISLFRETKAENALAHSYAGYGRLHKQQRRIPEAREYLTRALEIFVRLGTLIEPDRVRRELADLPG